MPPPAEFSIIKQGQLDKLNSSNKWQRRWFVLDSQHIQYFGSMRSVSQVDKTRTVAKWKARIPVATLTLQETEAQDKRALELKAAEGCLVLGFGDDEQRQQWAAAIMGAQSLAQGLTGSVLNVKETVEPKSLGESRMSMRPTQPSQPEDTEPVAEPAAEETGDSSEVPDMDLYEDEDAEDGDGGDGGDGEQGQSWMEQADGDGDETDVLMEMPVMTPTPSPIRKKRATVRATEGLDDIFNRMQQLELEGKHTEAAELMASAYITAQRKYMVHTDPTFKDDSEHENPNVIDRNRVAKALRDNFADEILSEIPEYKSKQLGQSIKYNDDLAAELNKIPDKDGFCKIKVNFASVGAKE